MYGVPMYITTQLKLNPIIQIIYLPIYIVLFTYKKPKKQ